MNQDDARPGVPQEGPEPPVQPSDERDRNADDTYDLIVRFGGDEFVCALLDLGMSEATKRFEAVNADLAETENGSITVGLAELQAEDLLGDILARADEALYRERERKQR